MDKQTLLKKFEAIVDEFERGRVFGSVEVCFNRGHAEVIRKLVSEKYFTDREHTRGFQNH